MRSPTVSVVTAETAQSAGTGLGNVPPNVSPVSVVTVPRTNWLSERPGSKAYTESTPVLAEERDPENDVTVPQTDGSKLGRPSNARLNTNWLLTRTFRTSPACGATGTSAAERPVLAAATAPARSMRTVTATF